MAVLDIELGETVERLRCAADQDERWGILTGVLAENGADQINYAVLNLADGDRSTASVTQFSTMDASWIEHYIDRRLDLNDPHVAYARDGNLRPYAFHERLSDALVDPGQRDVIRQAAEAGLRSQISFLAPDQNNPRSPIGGMTIGSSITAREFYSGVVGKEAGLLAIGMLFHNLSIGEVRRGQVGARPLSARERDCLTYLALGLRTTRIAERLGIAEVTVELHLRNARRKLRAATSAQAVARGLQFGDLSI